MEDTKIVTSGTEYVVPIWERVTLNLKEAAAYSGISESTLRYEVRRPKCSFVLKVGKKYMIKRKAFEEFLENTYQI